MRDVTEKTDMLGTLGNCGAPNFRQAWGSLAVFGMGQPSLLGFRQVLQKLQKDGYKVSTRLAPLGTLLPRIALQLWENDSQEGAWLCTGERRWWPRPGPAKCRDGRCGLHGLRRSDDGIEAALEVALVC